MSYPTNGWEQTIITSTQNKHVKLIRNLRNRKEREQSGLFFVEGIRQAAEAIQMGAAIDTLVVAPELLHSEFAQELVSKEAKTGTNMLQVSADVFRSFSAKDGPQGLAAIVKQRWEQLSDVRLGDDECFVALDAVQDPGNLGTIMRTADAVGFSGVILLGNATDPYDPGAVRASMGSVFSLRLAKASASEFIAWKQERAYSVVGTSGEGSEHYRSVNYPRPLIILSGSERQGLSPELMQACNQLVRIPMVGRCDSLNLAVATSVVLYEVFNQVNPVE